MGKKSSVEPRAVRRSAGRLPAVRAEDLLRLKRASARAVDTSDLPERPNAALGARPSAARLLSAERPSLLREAIVKEMARQNLTAYALTKHAKVFCETLSQSAVYEFLKGQRQLEVRYADALLRTLRLQIVPNRARALDPKTLSSRRRTA